MEEEYFSQKRMNQSQCLGLNSWEVGLSVKVMELHLTGRLEGEVIRRRDNIKVDKSLEKIKILFPPWTSK